MQAFGIKDGIKALAIATLLCSPFCWAQPAYKVQPDTALNAPVFETTAVNIARPDNALVLYTPAFGPTTQTNPYGVEVVAVEKKAPNNVSNNGQKQYVVQNVTSVWMCEKQQLSACGNASIPANGIILSATGSERKPLLDTFKPGNTLTLTPIWFSQASFSVSAINPNLENNPIASAFPGFRAGNQLVAYNNQYGQTKTGTNEFGFEVTVVNNRVVAQEGSDSTIPTEGEPQTSFVLSGHGKARDWLIAHASIGSAVFLDPLTQTVSSQIDLGQYQYQVNETLKALGCEPIDIGLSSVQTGESQCAGIASPIQKLAALYTANQLNQAAFTLAGWQNQLETALWKTYSTFPDTAIKAVWHRPVEKNRLAIRKTLARLKTSGTNAIFLETFFHGYPIFPSKTMAAYGLPMLHPSLKNFAEKDPLAVWVEEAHAQGIKVHTWFQTFYVGNKIFATDVLPYGPILTHYPQWANVQFSALTAKQEGKADTTSPTNMPALTFPARPVPSTVETGGYFLDPANPEVTKFLTTLAEELTDRYAIDGFQLDYIRYPGSFPPDRYSYLKTTWGYTATAVNEFKSQQGFDPLAFDKTQLESDQQAAWQAWQQYKQQKVTDFVVAITNDLHQKHPALFLSADIFPSQEEALRRKHQDWAAWAENAKLNALVAMTLTSAPATIERDTQNVRLLTQNRLSVITGVFGPFNGNEPVFVLNQVQTAQKAGADGLALFDSAHLSNRMMSALRTAKPQ